MERTFTLYQKYMPLDTDSWKDVQLRRNALKDELPDLELAVENRANSILAIAQGRGEALINSYERRFALMEEKARLTHEINESSWPELLKHFRRWRISGLIKGNTTDKNLSEIKKTISGLMNSLATLGLKGISYDEALEVISSYLASDDRSTLYEGTARKLKKKIKRVIVLEAELGASPSLETLKTFGKEIVRDLTGEARLLSVKTAKAAHRRFRKQLKWGLGGYTLPNLSSFVEGLTQLWSDYSVRKQARLDRDLVIAELNNGGDILELTGADELGPFRAEEIKKEVTEAGHDRWALHRLLSQVNREKAWAQRPLSNLRV